MKNLLGLFLSLSLFLGLSPLALSQVDAKLNVGSLLTLGLNASAEVPVGAQGGLALGVGYSSLELTVNEEGYSYRNLKFIPEYRHYFNPRQGYDRWFLGGYGKVIGLRGEAGDDGRDVNLTRLALGGMAGHKWVYPSGIVLELNTGLGLSRAVGSGDAAFRRAINTLPPLDLRLGLLLGYRF